VHRYRQKVVTDCRYGVYTPLSCISHRILFHASRIVDPCLTQPSCPALNRGIKNTQDSVPTYKFLCLKPTSLRRYTIRDSSQRHHVRLVDDLHHFARALPHPLPPFPPPRLLLGTNPTPIRRRRA
jgi:hypothetical protein